MKSIYDALRGAWHRVQDSPRLRLWMKAGTLLFTVAFMVFLLIQGREELRQFDDWRATWRAYLAACAQGFLLYPLSLIVQAWIWGMMIARLGQLSGGWRDVEIYAYTHLMRRLPGAVWYLAGRTVIYREWGIGARVTLAASGLEWLLLIAAAASLGGALSLSGPGSWLLGSGLLALFVLAISWGLRTLPSVRGQRWVPQFARNGLAKLSTTAMPRNRDLALWVILYAVAYIVGGSILFLLLQGVAPDAGITLRNAIRIWALAGGLGFLITMFVPIGVGIPELTLTALLVPYMPLVGALLIAVLLRMLFIVSDLVWGGLMWALARLMGRRRPGEE
jgi:hypothetical protein